jgi:O-antigen ligase
MYMQGNMSFARASELNRLSWLLCSAVLLTLVFVARGQLLAKTPMGTSGYGVLDRMPTVAGMAMVRATGISRMAAIPAIVGFVGIWESRGSPRIAWLAVFVPCFYLVWVMQARGSTSSLAISLALIMILLGGRARRLGWMFIFVAILIYMSGFIQDDTIHHYYLFAMRGEQGERLESMSGRDRIFREAWKKITESPLIGYGPQADRQFSEIGNAQNGPLYALLCGGVLGGIGYLGGLVASWIMLIQALRQRRRFKDSERMMLLSVTGIMAFLTMRNIPENTAALYSIDLLLQLPALVYIGELNRLLKRSKEVARSHRVLRMTVTEPAGAYTANVRA